MSSASTPDSRRDDLGPELEMMADISTRLTEAICAAVPGWVHAAIEARIIDLDERSGTTARVAAAAAAEAATDAARDELTTLLAGSVDDQRSTPLAVVRHLVRFPNAVLDDVGATRARRDPFDERANPDDIYAIAVATWSDLGDEVMELGMAWGAAKAYLHKALHRDATGDAR